METNGSETGQHTQAKPIPLIYRDDFDPDDAPEAFREGYEAGKRIFFYAALKDLKRNGLLYQQIADIMGVSIETVEQLP